MFRSDFVKQIFVVVAVAAATIAPIPALRAAEATTAPGKLGFKAQNKVFKADGEFKSWRFTKVDIPGGDIEKGTVEIEVDIASVSTNADKLTEHLKQNDMLDAAKFPKATIKIHSAKKTGEGTYEATADLTLRGITKSVPVKFKTIAGTPLRVEGEAVVNRLDYEVYKPYDAADERSVEPSVAITLSATLPDKI
jgi:polyisoprenoid-binding protein YceI